MKTTIKTLAFLLVSIALIFESPGPAHATVYRSFLRINKVYVLYTDPIVPHTDAQGNFWVGLEPFASLIGARFAEAQDGSASLTLGRRRIVFIPGEATAVLDGKPIRLPVAAKRIGASHHIVIPLQPLLSAFDLHSQWDQRYHILTLTESKILNQGAAGEFSQLVLDLEGPPSGFVAQVKAFTGPPYPLFPIVPISCIQHSKYAEWNLKNLSGQNISGVFIGEETKGYSYYDSGTNALRIPQTLPETYPIRAHSLLRHGFPILGSSSHKPLRYVIGRIVP